MKQERWVDGQAWLGMLDADRETLYLSAMANRMRRIHQGTSVFVALGATSAFALIVSGLPGVVWSSAISLLVAVVAIWSMIFDYSRKSAVAASLASECSELASDWRKLWSELSSLSDDEALRRVQDLERKDREITKSVPHDLGISRRLNEKCAKQAYQLIQHEYDVALA